jgi:methylmalonyl-CoA mutase N-terminal domain/subunit
MSDPVQTPSGIPLEPVYGPADRGGDPPAPGTFPFTRGNFASGYRGKTWTFRQYSGFGTAEESNRRYRYLLDQGGTGLSVALDLPTQCGYDSDDPEFGEEVGRVGVAVDTLADAEILFDGIPVDKISTSFTINGTAAILLAFYVAAAERKGVPRAKLIGTIQNDILKEYASRGTWIWPPEPSLRLIADTIEFCAAEVPRFNAISVAGAHFRDAGANAVQEMAFTLADGVTYCDTVVERGRMTIDQFAPQISFFFYTHGDFFEEIAKYRAGRRRWATIVRERYGASTDKASMFRFGVWQAAPPSTHRRPRTTSCAWPTRRWPRCWAVCSPCSPPPGTSRSRCPARSPQRWRCAPSRSWLTRPASRRWPIRWAGPISWRRSPTRPRPRSSRSCMISRRTAAWCAPSRTVICRA